jgi:succinyl-diaminopimelate desuccinylase
MDSIALLSKLVSIGSVFPREREIGEFLEECLKNAGFSVQRQEISPGRFNVLAERGTRGRPVLFYGHMDTVPAEGEWKRSPCAPHEEGDRLYGLGAWDMKAGVAAIAKAAEETKGGRRIKIAFGVDEENVSAGAQAIARSGFLDDAEAVVVTEGPLENAPGATRCGPNIVGLGRRGRAVYRIEVTGEPAHGATGEGASALVAAAEIVKFLTAQKLRKHETLPAASQFVRSLHSDSAALTVPDKAVLELDRHLVPPETFGSVLGELQGELKRFEKGNVKINVSLMPRETPYLAPYLTDRSDAFVKRVCDIVAARFGKAEFGYGLSVADENVFATKRLPVVTLGPVGGSEHNPGEWVSKKSYLELIEVLKALME